MESKKKNVSLRMSQSDIDRVHQIAERLGVKESDVFRFAVKQLLVRMAPFQEQSYTGIDLMPALLEIGEDLVRFFELDADQLTQIINGGMDEDGKWIDPSDLKLLALSGVNERYAMLKLNSDTKAQVEDQEGFKNYFREKYFNSDNTHNKASLLNRQHKFDAVI